MLEIRESSLITSLQDAGRFGYQRFGVPPSGPMDWFAHHAANILVNNPQGEACIELGFTSAVFKIACDALIAITGAGYSLTINQVPQSLWTSIWCSAGDVITLSKQPGGNWVYLAVGGGFQTVQVLNSSSTYLKAGLGHNLQQGERLILKGVSQNAKQGAGRTLPKSQRLAYQSDVSVRALPGLQTSRFTSEGLQAFWNGSYLITPNSDRMGYRLQGELITHTKGADIVSQGMVLGAVQVPANGQPIVMMPDHPTTGGYTQIAVVIKADLPLIAQCEMDLGRVQFEQVTLEESHLLKTDLKKNLKHGIIDDMDDWMLL